MRIRPVALVVILAACTFNVQHVASAPVTGSTDQAFTALEADLRSLGSDETLVTVRGDRATGATSSVTLTGVVASGASASALAAGLHATWTAVDASTARFAIRYDGPSRDTVEVSLVELHVPAAVALGSDAGAADYDVSGVTGPMRLTTESGAVTVVGGGTVDVTSPAGAIDVTATSVTIHGGAGALRFDAGTIGAQTTGGSIRGTVRGGGTIGTDGGGVQLTIAATIASDLTIDTHGGAVHLTLDPSAQLVLDLDASVGSVHVATSGITREGSPFVATVGAGGPRVTVRTRGGAITVVSP